MSTVAISLLPWTLFIQTLLPFGGGETCAQLFIGMESLVTNVEGMKSKKQFVNTLLDNDAIKPIIKSRHDSATDHGEAEQMPVIDLNDLIGRTFLMNRKMVNASVLKLSVLLRIMKLLTMAKNPIVFSLYNLSMMTSLRTSFPIKNFSILLRLRKMGRAMYGNFNVPPHIRDLSISTTRIIRDPRTMP
jgi:hypothetical protein